MVTSTPAEGFVMLKPVQYVKEQSELFKKFARAKIPAGKQSKEW